MEDVVFEIVVAIADEPKLAVPIREVSLRGEENPLIAYQLDRSLHQRGTDSSATCPCRGSDAPDPHYAVSLVQDPQGRHHRAVALDPQESRAWFKISSIKFSVWASLFDNKDIHSKSEHPIEQLRRYINQRPVGYHNIDHLP